MIPTWWSRLWGIAVIAHVIGNPRFGQLFPDPSALGVATAIMLVGAVVLVLQPAQRVLLVGVAVAMVTVAWLEAPVIGNHWQLAALVALATLAGISSRKDSEWFPVVGRWMLLGFYGWAAFAKFNEAFFDPAVSCGLVYANQALGSWGLPTIAVTSPMAWGPIIGSAVVEAGVFGLLLFRKTRWLGVLLGLTFHGLVSLDLGQHFYDFTAFLIPLFLLFLPDEYGSAVGNLSQRVARPFVLVAGGIGLASLLPASPVIVGILGSGAFIVWVPYLAWVFWALRRLGRPSASVHNMRLTGVVAPVLVAVVVAIGTLPYLEFRTATSWNMYANLQTAAGESNHYLVRRTFPVTDHQERIVEVLSSTDWGLQLYADGGYGIIERQFLDYLADHPDAEATYRINGVTYDASGSDLGVPAGNVETKLQFFRSIDLTSPPRCQERWLPAG